MPTPILHRAMHDPRDPIVKPRLRMVQMPIPPATQPRETEVSCCEAVDRVVETFGVPSVLRAVALVLAANGYDPADRWDELVSDLAEGQEQL